MADRATGSPQARQNSEVRQRAIATAWQIHAALADWTKSLDAKASFALATESAVLGAVVAVEVSGSGTPQPAGVLPSVLLVAGVVLLAASALCAAMSVIPRASTAHRRGIAPPGDHDFIFYGHLRTWSPQQLTRRLTEADPLEGLSRQLVAMSVIAWAKHRYVRQSLLLALGGTAFLGLAAILS